MLEKKPTKRTLAESAEEGRIRDLAVVPIDQALWERLQAEGYDMTDIPPPEAVPGPTSVA